MLRRKTVRGRKNERGIVILLVAIVLLFVVSAIAALAIDLVTFYTARSEAQLAADGAALAGARVLANSGMTSRPSDTTLAGYAKGLATTIAQQVGQNNKVGGRNLNGAGSPLNCGQEICVAFNDTDSTFGSNPHVTVQVTRSDLPTFFARIWGRGTVIVKASATAEAYNPSGLNTSPDLAPPVAPTCVKPWVLPNISPTDGTTPIFDPTTGAIQDPALLGFSETTGVFRARCDSCGNPTVRIPQGWRFYPGDPSSFPVPTQALPACNVALNGYQNSIAGCVQTPIGCNSTVNLDHTTTANLNPQAAQAVNCLTHSLASQGDQIDPTVAPSPPFQFHAGLDNPVVSARGTDVLVSDSLVTVPVYESTTGTAPATNPVTIIGFVQLFLNPDGMVAPGGVGGIKTTVVNIVGCGTNATTAIAPILGHGSSPVPVRLISPP